MKTKENKDWISELFRDFGVGIIAGSIMLSYLTIQYWYFTFIGMIFLFLSVYLKNLPSKSYKDIERKIYIISIAFVAIIGMYFSFKKQIVPFFSFAILICFALILVINLTKKKKK